MKLVYLADWFPKISETFTLYEVLELQRKGISVDVVALNRSRETLKHAAVSRVRSMYYLEVTRNPFAVLAAHLRKALRHPAAYLRALAAFSGSFELFFKIFVLRIPDVDSIRALEADRIHAPFASRAAELALLCRFFGGPAFTFTSYRFDLFDRPMPNLRTLSRMALRHVTVSEYNRDYLVRRLGVAPEHVQVIRSGIRLTGYPVASPSAHRGSRIVCVARLEKVKSVETLIEACAVLRDRGRSFECVLVGDGSERPALEALCRRRGLEGQVRFAGLCAHEDSLRWTASSRLMVLPSRSEGIPLSLMEAMALGAVVVATRVCGVPELVQDGETGLLVETGDAQALALAIERLLGDESLCRRLAENARRQVEKNYYLPTQTERLVRIWNSPAE